MAIFNGWRITRAGVVFIAGAIILAGLVFGGVYWVVQRGEQARREEAIAVAEGSLQEQPTPIAEEKPAKEETEGRGSSASDRTDSERHPDVFPETGADVWALVAVVVLALAGGYYVQSRRLVRGL